VISVRRVVQLAVVLSVVAPLVFAFLIASADSQIDNAYGGDDPDEFWPIARGTALLSAAAIAVIWLGVFVIYVVRKGARALR
jgi:hypothetical protein